MARRTKAFDIWKQMKPASLRKLALAVFLMFGAFGPVTILMESELHVVTWQFVLIQTLSSGGLAATVVLFSRRSWWLTMLIIFFWSAIMVWNGGGMSLMFSGEGFRVKFSGPVSDTTRHEIVQDTKLSIDELKTIYTQRGTVGLMAIGLIVSGYIVFIRIVTTEVRERSRLQTEITIAQDIQQSLLPEATFQNSCCIIAGKTIAATEVGGDYFDVVPLVNGNVVVVIADVTGHGVGAGILSAMTKSALHTQLQHDASPSKMLEHLNQTIYNVSDEKTFVTCAYMHIDIAGKIFSIATAGHPPVLYKRSNAGTIVQLRTVSLGLGIQSGSQYTSLEQSFEQGDTLLLYTDGLLEATNSSNEQYGIERLEQLLHSSHQTVQETCVRITSELEKFTGKSTFPDDVSLVCVKFI